MEDEGKYTFSFQFNNHGKTYVLKTSEGNETELRVNVHPKIVDLRMEFTNDNTSSRLFCKAEAKPRPNITWLNPEQHLVDASEVLVDENVPNKLQIVSILRITGKKLSGNYSCLVKNKYGLARRHIFYKGFKYERIFYVIVGWSVILVLYLIFLLAYGSCIYNRKFEKAKSIKGTLPTKGPKETRTFAGMCHQMNSLAPSSESCDYTDFEVPQVDCVYAVVQMSKS
uniref:Ig-like domain-containing protein n=1 Tax=Eptatretus burgeri TaxID=7764 RepID=A0A8C4R3F3_EPTBU